MNKKVNIKTFLRKQKLTFFKTRLGRSEAPPRDFLLVDIFPERGSSGSCVRKAIRNGQGRSSETRSSVGPQNETPGREANQGQSSFQVG